MKKTRKFRNRIIAGILSAVTIISVGAMSITSTSAFAIPGIAETVLSTTFGYAKDEVKELSAQTSNYHTQQMNQLRAINSNIDTKDFRVQADTVAADFAHALKRIDENKANITCDGNDKINNTTYKAYKEILADPKCNVSAMQANFDEMLRFLRGQRTSNNNENGYRQLTNYGTGHDGLRHHQRTQRYAVPRQGI